MSAKIPPPLINNTLSALSWCHRAANAVGSDRFAETLSRASFYAQRASQLAVTPGESAVVAGLVVALDELITANAQGRVLLCDSVSGMNAAEATEFIEMVEGGEDIPLQ